MMEYPKVQPTIDNTYLVMEDYRYKDVVVPEGYKTNGANVPRLLWSLVPPFKPKYLHAVVVHDYLCDREEYEKADRYFAELLYEVEVSVVTKSMVKAVVIYHKIRYNYNKSK